METGAETVRLLDRTEGRAVPRHLLFLDADLAESAAAPPRWCNRSATARPT